MSPIVIGIIVLCLLGLLYLLQGHRISGFQDQTATNNTNNPFNTIPTPPQRFLDKTLWEDKIANKPSPPGVDFTGEVIYAPVDLAADIVKIKNDIANIVMNEPGNIRMEVENQILPLVGSAMRINGFPLTDESYGLSCE